MDGSVRWQRRAPKPSNCRNRNYSKLTFIPARKIQMQEYLSRNRSGDEDEYQTIGPLLKKESPTSVVVRSKDMSGWEYVNEIRGKSNLNKAEQRWHHNDAGTCDEDECLYLWNRQSRPRLLQRSRGRRPSKLSDVLGFLLILLGKNVGTKSCRGRSRVTRAPLLSPLHHPGCRQNECHRF